MTALPGLTPRSPLITVGPVLVTAEPPRTAKAAAVPSEGAVAADRVCNETVEKTSAIAVVAEKRVSVAAALVAVVLGSGAVVVAAEREIARAVLVRVS